MVIWVKEEEMKQFLPLVPKNMQDAVIMGEYFCLGALSEDEEGSNEKTAAGVLLLSEVDGVLFDGEITTMIVIHWLYVAEDFRLKGLANDLMAALSDVLEDSPASGIICDVPFDSEYDLAEAFFSSWGFQFRVTDSYEMIISKDDCREQINAANKEESLSLASSSRIPEGMVSVQEIDRDVFTEAVSRAKKLEKSGYYKEISEDKDHYAGDMSYAYLHDGKISSLVLFERLSYDHLHMVMLATLDPKGEKELLTLLHYTAGYFYLNYPEHSTVWLTLGTERSRKLATHIFPGKDPVMVRRGYYS